MENGEPFAPFGNTGTNFAPGNVVPGPFTIRAEAFSGDNATGNKIADESITLTVKDVTTEPPPDPDPDPDPPPVDPPPVPGTDPWGLSLMPVRPGMKTAFYTNFREDGDRAIGTGFGPHLSKGWKARENMPDSAGGHGVSGIGGVYSGKNTWSQKGGIGDVFLHAHNAGDDPTKHNPAGKILDVFTALDQAGELKEGFVQWTQKDPTCEPFKQAPLWWPSEGKNENGEDDHNEHKYGPGPRSNAFHHLARPEKGQEGVQLNIDTTIPHTFGAYHRTKGTNGASDPGEFSVYVDNKLVKTFTNLCCQLPMHWNMQIETYLFSDAFWKLSPRPPIQSGHVQMTQYRMDVRA
jgi:hypothetical protein